MSRRLCHRLIEDSDGKLGGGSDRGSDGEDANGEDTCDDDANDDDTCDDDTNDDDTDETSCGDDTGRVTRRTGAKRPSICMHILMVAKRWA